MAQHLLNPDESILQTWLADNGYPKYRGAQIRKWLYRGRANAFADMTDLPEKLREELAEAFQLWTSQLVTHSKSDDGTEKLLLQMQDGGRIECVLIREGSRRTICVSSQVGCAMGCVFCATGIDGVARNLTAGEIIEQLLLVQRLLPQEERLTNIVMMGMGEPMANLDEVLPALDVARADAGFGISARRIAISTVGLPSSIDRLSETGIRYQLAISLHAPNDELRQRLVPVNQRTGVDAILAAADRYYAFSGRKITYEYVLLDGLNDHVDHARQLIDLLKDRPALLNVIPYNPVPGLPYKTPSEAAQTEFRQVLESSGLMVRFRQRKGDEINAACGQLRRITPPGPNVVQLSE